MKHVLSFIVIVLRLSEFGNKPISELTKSSFNQVSFDNNISYGSQFVEMLYSQSFWYQD